jgi:hypothetical protein
MALIRYKDEQKLMTDARPYFNWRIDELESLHRTTAGDRSLSQAILDELMHRTTGRAFALRLQVQEAMAGQLPAPIPASQATPAGVVLADPIPVTEVMPTPSTPPVPAAVAKPPIARRPYTEKSNDPAAILASWIALEALSPQTYRRPADLANEDKRRVALLGAGLPWFRDERSRPNYQLYYQIVLGSIPVDRATNELMGIFGNDEERNEREREREKAVIAAVLVDRNGILLDDNAVSISSFAWALPIALSGDLARLGGWANVERGLIEGLTRQLAHRDQDGNPLPIDGGTVDAAFRWLVETLGLPDGLHEAPSFALRVFHHFKAKGPPEAALLNSFFLTDLSRAFALAESGRPGKALARYISLDHVEHSPNLLGDPAGIESLVAPGKTPAARWPAPGGHPLVTLQQAAVNAVRSELGKDSAGIVAVNGPPGTGKTTLLRDIAAACVLDRASAMSVFEDPLTAFSTTGQKVAAGRNAFLHLYRLHDTLKGHEILVASSNNKAVENISKELPVSKAIGNDLRYFRTVSDRLLCKKENDGSLTPGEPTWGLIAAVLGNAANRNAFQEALWWDADRSLRLYLKSAKGDCVVREVTEAGQVVRREMPTVVAEEAPPTPEQAKIQWKKARTKFKSIKEEVEAELRELESVRNICKQLPSARRTLEEATIARDAAFTVQEDRKSAHVIADDAMARAQAGAEVAGRLERQALSERPGWLSRLFRTAAFKRWRAAFSPLVLDKRERDQDLARAAEAFVEADKQAVEASVAARVAEGRMDKSKGALSFLETVIDEHRKVLGERIVDDRFFEGGHERWNLASPWISDALHSKRESLFAAALDLHRAFIDMTAQKIAHNLGILMGAMQAGAFKDDAKKGLLGDLWSTLYLVVPVLSTTFASVDRMLGDLPPSSIGWLLIDEAGQATPQAAVGAVMRSKRVIVVGDPLQIPPVVSLPQRLVLEVARYFNLDPDHWLAPEASVQTVSDGASRYQAEFRADVWVRQVGIPLLVHRRCQEPMFGISNSIAYDGQMVHAAGMPSAGPTVQALGPSAWFDVDGDAESNWCEAEGELVVRLLERVAAAGVVQPDVYIITPFRIVAYEMRRRLEAEANLFRLLDVTDVDGWLKERVGTIHTFQGKEAEAVVAVLGAPMAAQQGARRWATSSPNILNVMVSRAKNGLYVIGSRATWGATGYAREVAARLPVRFR